MHAKKLEKVLPVVGSIVLLLSWAVQTLLFANWNATAAKLAGAESVLQSYRASDGVLRALRAIVPPDKLAAVDGQQETNFDRGIIGLRTVMDSDIYRAKRDQVFSALADGATTEQLTSNARVDLEYNAIQLTLATERTALTGRVSAAESTFLLLYALGTLLVIGGGIVRLLPAAPYAD
jgi:hypothetical protein